MVQGDGSAAGQGAVTIRAATPDDAPHMVDLVDMAGHGLPMALWRLQAGSGGDARALGLAKARREAGGFVWRNARMAVARAEDGGEDGGGGMVAGMAMVWRLPDAPVPSEDVPPLARPLQELENLCPGLPYLGALAVAPGWRGQGIGRRLLKDATGRGAVCLIVGSGNGPAIALYQSAGFTPVARRTALGGAGWTPPHADWVLMRRCS